MTGDKTFNETSPVSATPGAQRRVALIVYHLHGAQLVPLAPNQPVVVGREPPAHVVVSDKSLSRQHAKFSIEDNAVAVEDLGSTNGTLHRGKPIERTLLGHGDQVQLGAVVVTIHAAGAELEAEEIAGHDRFVKWVDEELRRARFFRRPLCLAMVRRAYGEREVRALLQSLRPRLRPVDRLGLYADGILEIVAPEVSARELKLRLLESGASQETLLCGLAEFPEMATSTEELFGAAWGALCRATPDETAVLADDGMPTGVRRASDSIPALTEPQSKRMHQLMNTLERVARGVVPVLLLGETGTGKEVLACRLHEMSPRRDAPLVCVNCAAIPAQLVESALFGHEKGAFTGATQQAQGVFEAADRGTVFLDEIGELPPSAQAAILRVLEQDGASHAERIRYQNERESLAEALHRLSVRARERLVLYEHHRACARRIASAWTGAAAPQPPAPVDPPVLRSLLALQIRTPPVTAKAVP